MKDFPLAVLIWSCLLDFEVEMLSRPLTESGVQEIIDQNLRNTFVNVFK